MVPPATASSGTRPFAQSHAEIEQRLLADLRQKTAMRWLGGAMGRHAMVQRIGPDAVENGGGGGCHIAIDQHWNALQPRGKDGARHGRKLSSAHAAKHFERIREMRPVKRNRAAHGIGLAFHTLGVDTGSGPHPLLGRSAKECV